jgi:hypothetical protein
MSSGVGLILGNLGNFAKSCAVQVWRIRSVDGKGKSDPLVERVRPIWLLHNARSSKRTESQNRKKIPGRHQVTRQ